jgi:MFS family permease
MGIGSLVGALGAAARAKPSPTLLAGSAGALGVFMLGITFAPSLAVAIPALALAGAATITFLSTANSLLQLSASMEMRGRVMALYALVFLGSTPIGGPIVGAVAQRFDPRAGFGIGAAAALVGGIGAAAGLHRAKRRTYGGRFPSEPVPAEPAAA